MMITRDLIEKVSEEYGLSASRVELDYQMTRVLSKLSKELPYGVFKGGTSLFKCQRISNRFSEDLDISFDHQLSREERKEVKDAIIRIADSLDMKIMNLYNTKIKRDYNCYLLKYNSLFEDNSDENKAKEMTNIVKIETSMNSESFPRETLKVHSLVGDYLEKHANDHAGSECGELMEELSFDMQVQSLERTYVDKVFALCDYYINGKTDRYSRHIFDLYKISPCIEKNDGLKELIGQVRKLRANSFVSPSAKENVSVPKLLTQIVNEDYYEEDYTRYSSRYDKSETKYESAIELLRELASSDLFA